MWQTAVIHLPPESVLKGLCPHPCPTLSNANAVIGFEGSKVSLVHQTYLQHSRLTTYRRHATGGPYLRCMSQLCAIVNVSRYRVSLRGTVVIRNDLISRSYRCTTAPNVESGIPLTLTYYTISHCVHPIRDL